MDKHQRAIFEHVVYENTEWQDAFNFSFHVSRTIPHFCQIFSALPREAALAKIVDAVGDVCAQILVSDPPLTYDVSREAVSFHHPYHWTLACLIQVAIEVGGPEY